MMRRPTLISLATATTLAVACVDDPTSIASPDGVPPRVQVAQQQAPATLILEPPTATNPVGTPHILTAHVRNALGQPVPGVTVEFDINGAEGFLIFHCTTDPNGQCSITYTRSQPGEDIIVASADADGDGEFFGPGDPSNGATKTWTPAPPATLTLTPPTAANSVGTTHTVTADVRDALGQPVSGIIVRFSISGAHTVNGSCTTNGNGQCTFSYAGTSPGADVISAYADTDGDNMQDPDEPTAVATKEWTPLQLRLEPLTATNPTGNTHTVTAHVTDVLGQPVSGIIVRFTIMGAHNLNGSCTTNGMGRCTFSYTGTQPGTDGIRAYADTDGDGVQDPDEPTAAATKIWTAPTGGCPANGGDDDEDDDGLEDRDENLFGTLIGIRDSDGDGIVDGNEDSDGDGTDDEDEDDDDDDDCPNDSDGDGTDDEDEDDDRDD